MIPIEPKEQVVFNLVTQSNNLIHSKTIVLTKIRVPMFNDEGI